MLFKSFMEFKLTFMILMLMSIIFYMVNKLEKWDKLTSMIFECGFSSFNFFRFSFSSHYFLIAIIFLFLDLEFCFLLPYLYKTEMSLKSFFFMIILIYLILAGLFVECKSHSINWKM